MKVLSRRDLISASITGLTTGVIAWQILLFLDRGLPGGISPAVLAILVPVLWIFGVQFGYILGAIFKPFTQFGRFAAIGFANAAVDFGVLYLGIALIGIAEGSAYALLKSFSFFVATIHSYLWNKHWAFSETGSTGGMREVASFISVTVASLLLNVAVASLVVTLRPEAADVNAWAGVGAIAGSAVALIFSFTGFRLFVFKRK